MILSSPAALWLLLISLPIIGLFLFRRRAIEVEVPSVVFWHRSAQSDQPTRLGHRFGRWLALLVQLLILLMLVLGLADPNPSDTIRHLLIVLDDSATMQTREAPDQTRFALAKRRALRDIHAVPPHTMVSVILAGEPPTVLADHGADRPGLESAVQALTPRDVNSRIPAALRMAATVAREPSRVLVLTDRPRTPLPALGDAEWIQLGSYNPNVGITGFQLTEEGNELAVVVANHGFAAQVARLSILSNETQVGLAEITLPDYLAEIRIPVTPSAGQPFTIRLEPSDALPLDNAAYGVWPCSETVRVRVATDDNPPLLAALDQPQASLEIVPRRAWTEHHGGGVDVTVLDSPTNAAADARGRFIVLGGKDPFGLCTASDSRTEVKPIQWASSLPLLSALDLTNWRIRRTARLGPGQCLTSLVEANDLSLIMMTMRRPPCDAQLPDGLDVVYLNFDLHDSNLASPNNCSLPIFLWRVIDELRGRPDPNQPLAYATGLPRSTTVKAGKTPALEDPTGAPCPASTQGGRIVVLQPDRCGHYAAALDDGAQFLAFNWSPEDPYADAGPSEESQTATLSNTGAWSSTVPHGWELCLAFAGLLLLIEAWLFHRHLLRIN
jgi:hypothetical protein